MVLGSIKAIYELKNLVRLLKPLLVMISSTLVFSIYNKLNYYKYFLSTNRSFKAYI